MTWGIRFGVAAVLILAGFLWGARVQSWRGDDALSKLQAQHATETATREAQARRAIETARNQEKTDVDAMAQTAATIAADRDRIAAESAAGRRMFDAALAAARSARVAGVPQACPAAPGVERADPLEILRTAGERIISIGDEADALSVRAAALREIAVKER